MSLTLAEILKRLTHKHFQILFEVVFEILTSNQIEQLSPGGKILLNRFLNFCPYNMKISVSARALLMTLSEALLVEFESRQDQ